MATFVVVFILWIICSGIFEKKMIVLGVISSACAATISLNALTVKGIKTDNTYFVMGINPVRGLIYFVWLLKEVVLAAIDVSKIIFLHRDKIDSAYVQFKADFDNPVARAVLTDSITLTPGTITVKVDDDGIYTVHGLTEAARAGLLEGGMQKMVAKTFGEEIDYQVIEERILWPEHQGGVPVASRRAKKTRKAEKK